MQCGHSLPRQCSYEQSRMCLTGVCGVAGKFGTAASTGVVMPPKPQMIAKQDWRYVSGGGRVLRNAHEPSNEVTSLAFASNGNSLASRGADESLKVHYISTPAPSISLALCATPPPPPALPPLLSPCACASETVELVFYAVLLVGLSASGTDPKISCQSSLSYHTPMIVFLAETDGRYSSGGFLVCRF